MALADDSKTFGKDEYHQLDQKLNEFDRSVIPIDQKQHLTQYLDSLSVYAKKGMESITMEDARDAFYYLSKQMIELHQMFGHDEADPYYLTFCPMARDNAGAYWLQTVDTVYNSFYGDMMLRCGSIKEELPAHQGMH